MYNTQYVQNNQYSNQQQQPPQMTPQQLSDFVQYEEALKNGAQLNHQQANYYNELKALAIEVQKYQQWLQQQTGGGYVAPQNNAYRPAATGPGYRAPANTGMYPAQQAYRAPVSGGGYVAQDVSYGPQYGEPFVQHGGGPSTVTSANYSNKYSSNSNNMMDKKPIIEQPTTTAAPIEPVMPIEPVIPLEGYEYPFLTLPTQVCIKEAVEKYFIYSIIDKKDEEVEFNKHASIYKNSVTGVSQDIDLEDIKKIKFLEKTHVVENYNEAFNKMRLAKGDNKDNSLVNAGEFILKESGVVNKRTTDPVSFMFRDLVVNSKDLRDLAKNMGNLIASAGEFTRTTFSTFDSSITKYINLVFRNTLGSEWSIGSFIDDIDELFKLVADLKDSRKRTIYSNGLVDVYNAIKKNAEDIESSVDDEEVKVGVKVGLTYLTNRITVITTNSQDITYELSDLINNNIRFVQPSLTPALRAAIEAVYDNRDFDNRMLILLDSDGSQYRIMKTKLNVDYTIEKIK